MSSQSSVISVQTPRQTNYASAYIVQRALRKGRKASDELKNHFRSPDVGNRLITTGRHVEGVCQDFVLHGTKPVSYF